MCLGLGLLVNMVRDIEIRYKLRAFATIVKSTQAFRYADIINITSHWPMLRLAVIFSFIANLVTHLVNSLILVLSVDFSVNIQLSLSFWTSRKATIFDALPVP